MKSTPVKPRVISRLAASLLLLAAGGCSRSGPANQEAGPAAPNPAGRPVTEPEATARGREVSKALAEKLMTQLTAALEAGGPAEAVRVCRTIAHPVTEGEADPAVGIRVRRTAPRVRNPDNAPDAWDREVLARLQELRDSGKPFPEEVVSKDGDGFRYYKPLATKPLCLQCHGARETFDTALVERLTDLYPEDKAFGFAEGDLRGVIRVDIQPSEKR